jgi:hypothetical protein
MVLLFLICRVYGLSIYKDVDLAKLSNDKLSATIQAVAGHILDSLEQALESFPLLSLSMAT